MDPLAQNKTNVNEMSLKNAALYYASRGFRVVPAHSIIENPDGSKRCTCTNPTCNNEGKHPRTARGQTDATTDPTIIERWWEKWPNANIQIIPSSKSLIVVDVDPRHQGDLTWERWKGLVYQNELETFTVRSGGGGLHVYFQKPDKCNRIKNRANILGPGVDVKTSGLIVAPPSVHFSGNKYQVEAPSDFLILPEKMKRWASLPGVLSNSGHIVEGGRNDTAIAEIGGRLQGWRIEPQTIRAFMEEANELYCVNPLELRELEAGINNVINNFEPGNGQYKELSANPDRHDDYEALANTILTDNRFFLPTAKNAPMWWWNPASGLWEERGDQIIDHLVGKWRFGLPNSEKKPDMIKLSRNVHAVIRSAMRAKCTGPFPEGNKDEIYFSNGILNWQTREFREEYTPEDYATLKMPVPFKKDADTEFIDGLFHEWVNPEMVHMLYEMIFLCFIRQMPVQKLFLLYGPGQDGKSVFLSIIQEILGKTNCAFLEPQRMGDNYAAASLYHKLANICADIPHNELKKTSEIKRMTGGDMIQSRRPYKDFISFWSYATLIFSANKIPRTSDQSRGFYRRIQLIHFPNMIPAHKQDRLLVSKLGKMKAELAGVVSRAIAAGYALIDRGWILSNEDTIDQTRDRFLEMSDPIEVFLRRFTRNSKTSVEKAKFAEWFNRWLEFRGIEEWTTHKISRQMTRVKNIPVTSWGSEKCYEHININEQDLKRELGELPKEQEQTTIPFAEDQPF